MSKIYFFRHAQASAGAVNYDVLSPKGEQQAAELGQYLVKKKIIFDKVYAGPLRRQQHTCEIVKSIYDKEGLPMPEVITLDGLKEHEGPAAMKIIMPQLVKTNPFIKKLWEEGVADPKRVKPNTMLAFKYFLDEWSEGKFEVEGITPWLDFRENVKRAVGNILQNTGSGENIAAFTSGGTISAIAADSLGVAAPKRVIALNYSIRNTSFTSFFYSKGQFNLLALNELPHLEGEMVTFV